MTALEIMLWSLALGGIAAVAIVRLADLAVRPTVSRCHSAAFHITVFAFVAILSAMPQVLQPSLDPAALQAAQVLAGPFCVGLSAFWISGWLNARHRERMMARTLRLASVLTPLGGIACLLIPPSEQLSAAAAVSLTGSALTFG